MTPNIVFWHSKFYCDTWTEAKYRNSTFNSHFDIRTEAEYRVLTFNMQFDIRIGHEYLIWTFKILFWNSSLGRVSYFDLEIPILTFKLTPNIVFWYSKSYFDIWTEAEYRILTFYSYFVFGTGAQYHILTFKSYFDIQTGTEDRILTFKILFWHSNRCRISYFDFQNPILHSNSGQLSHFDFQIPILIFELRPNIVFWHSKSDFDIITGAEYMYHILHFTFKNQIWHPNWGWISYFDFQNPILT